MAQATRTSLPRHQVQHRVAVLDFLQHYFRANISHPRRAVERVYARAANSEPLAFRMTLVFGVPFLLLLTVAYAVFVKKGRAAGAVEFRGTSAK